MPFHTPTQPCAAPERLHCSTGLMFAVHRQPTCRTTPPPALSAGCTSPASARHPHRRTRTRCSKWCLYGRCSALLLLMIEYGMAFAVPQLRVCRQEINAPSALGPKIPNTLVSRYATYRDRAVQTPRRAPQGPCHSSTSPAPPGTTQRAYSVSGTARDT